MEYRRARKAAVRGRRECTTVNIDTIESTAKIIIGGILKLRTAVSGK